MVRVDNFLSPVLEAGRRMSKQVELEYDPLLRCIQYR